MNAGNFLTNFAIRTLLHEVSIQRRYGVEGGMNNKLARTETTFWLNGGNIPAGGVAEVRLIVIIFVCDNNKHDNNRRDEIYENNSRTHLDRLQNKYENNSRTHLDRLQNKYENNSRTHLDRLQNKYTNCKGIKNNTNSGQITGIQ